MLTITNHHSTAAPNAPDFSQIIEEGDYVSYFENQHGEQWVFVRKQGAERGVVYGGDVGWESAEVYERTPEQIREELLAEGIKKIRVDMIAKMGNPLVGGLILNDHERTWLYNAWYASSGLLTDRGALTELGRRLGRDNWSPMMEKHPNSTDYRAAMNALWLVVGREAGRRGLADSEITDLVQGVTEGLREREEENQAAPRRGRST